MPLFDYKRWTTDCNAVLIADDTSDGAMELLLLRLLEPHVDELVSSTLLPAVRAFHGSCAHQYIFIPVSLVSPTWIQGVRHVVYLVTLGGKEATAKMEKMMGKLSVSSARRIVAIEPTEEFAQRLLAACESWCGSESSSGGSPEETEGDEGPEE